MPELGTQLNEARRRRGLSLRDVERAIGVKSGHLSQLETGTIAKPEMALLWELSALYGIDFEQLLALAGHTPSEAETPGRRRNRMTVALRALGELTPPEQTEALRYMAELKARRDG